MQKISPLRSSIEAFNKFKLSKKANQSETNNSMTNPFGISFKGKVIQMDVFEKTQENKPMSPSLKQRLQETGKLLACAWVGTMNKFSQLKQNAIAFGNRVKENSINTFNKVKEFGGQKVEFDYFKYNVSNLVNKPTSELEEMLKAQLSQN